MKPSFSLVLLLALSACDVTAETDDRVATQSARIDALEAELSALAETLATLDQAVGGGQTTLTARLDAIEVDLAALDVAAEDASTDLTSLGSALDAVDADVAALQADHVSVQAFDQAADRLAVVEATYATSGAVSTAVSQLGARVTAVEGDYVSTTAVGSALSGVDARLAAIEGAYVSTTEAGSAFSGIDARLDAIEGAYASTSVVTSLVSSVETRLETVEGAYASSASVDAVAGRVRSIEDSTVLDVEDLMSVMVPDPDSGALTVTGDVRVDGLFRNDSLRILACANGGCTPKQCLDRCEADGMRLATTHDLMAWTAGRNTVCAYVWHVKGDGDPARGLPAYANFPTANCGPTNTGEVPRIGFNGVPSEGWSATTKGSCACVASP